MAACARSNLLESLDERQANEVVATMLKHNIQAVKQNLGKSGFVVRVGEADLPEAIELLQREDLPSAPRSQVASAFPADAMVSTPIGERARLLSAIEQRLEESLAVIAGVRTARVHVSYDAAPSQTRMQPQEPKMHVAAVVVHEEGVDTQALLQSVKRFLRNAFVQVEYDNVSVILSAEKPARRLGITRAEHRANVGLWAALAGMGVLLALLTGLFVIRRHGNAALRKPFRWRRTGAHAEEPKPVHSPSHG
jgi:type III secretion system inner membrane ring protein